MGVVNFETFKRTLAERSPAVDVSCPEVGGSVRLRRLSAAVGLAIGKQYNGLPKVDGKPRDDDMIELYVLLLANSIVDESGELFLQSEEGKAHLRSLSFGTISELGSEALILNGMAERTKKNDASGTTTSD